MKSRTTDRFWECYNKLPAAVRKQAKEAYSLFPIIPACNLNECIQFSLYFQQELQKIIVLSELFKVMKSFGFGLAHIPIMINY